VWVPRWIARAPVAIIRRPVMEIAVKKTCFLAVIERRDIFFPVCPGVPPPIWSDAVRSSRTSSDRDERAR